MILSGRRRDILRYSIAVDDQVGARDHRREAMIGSGDPRQRCRHLDYRFWCGDGPFGADPGVACLSSKRMTLTTRSRNGPPILS